MILPNRQGTKNARPAMRAAYGPHINWEDPDMYCAQCNINLDSAYGERYA